MNLAYTHLYNDKLRGATCGKEGLHEFNLTRKSNKVTCSDCLRHFAAQLEADCTALRELVSRSVDILSDMGPAEDPVNRAFDLKYLNDAHTALAANAGEGKEE